MGFKLSDIKAGTPLREKIEAELSKQNESETPELRTLLDIKPVTELTRSKVFHVKPMGKPRMTKRDRWKKRPVVERYWAFRDQMNLQRKGFQMPDMNYWIVAYIEIPKSYSKPKLRRNGQVPDTIHRQKPDKDNIEKAILDALLNEDSIVGDGRVTKLWCPVGESRIVIYY